MNYKKTSHKKEYDSLKVIGTFIVAVYSFYCISNQTEGLFSGLDLVIHEAGHMLFSYLGRFISVLGGTLFQILVPIGFVCSFYVKKEYFSSAFSVMWVGVNFFGIAVYVADATSMQLPLVTVGSASHIIHDWNYILSSMGMLKYDNAIASFFIIIGSSLCILSTYLCYISSYRVIDYDNIES